MTTKAGIAIAATIKPQITIAARSDKMPDWGGTLSWLGLILGIFCKAIISANNFISYPLL